MVPGWDVPSSEAALRLAARHPDLIDAAVGIHPHQAAEADEAAWRRIEELAAEPEAVAVGEIGLDFHRNLSPPDVQRAALERQLDLARRIRKPVLVHNREAHDAIGQYLTAWAGPPKRANKGVMHAFSGDAELAARLASAGFLISFALPVSFGSAFGPRQAAAALPPDALLVETDAPYLGPDRAIRNEPTTALRVVSELAHLRTTGVEELAEAIGANYARLTDRAAAGHQDIGLA
jgi:TatD DNase family protein